MKEILIDKVNNEYQEKFNELVRLYNVGSNGEESQNFDDVAVINANTRIFQEKLDELDRWKVTRLDECNVRAVDVHPTSDTIDELTYQAMIVHSFKKITIQIHIIIWEDQLKLQIHVFMDTSLSISRVFMRIIQQQTSNWVKFVNDI